MTAGWTIVEGADHCAMFQQYEGKGETQLTVGKSMDGHAILVLSNEGWSAREDQAYDLRYIVGGSTFEGAKSIGTAIDSSRHGFVASFEASFFGAFAKGSGLRVLMGETVVDSLDLQGSAAAMITVNRCVASIKAVIDAADKERRRFSHIADDPFKGTTPVVVPTPASKGREADWVSSDDYPASSLRLKEEGTTAVAYFVNTQGRIEDCRVTTSSGSAALDRATCSALTRRGRYSPQLGADGLPARVERSFSYTWKMPPQ
jgi:TonB family protein